jgi:ureidoacrylate peracid hydrolase
VGARRIERCAVNQRLQELLGSGSSALLVVDIQNDYIHPEGSLGRSGHDTSAVIAMIPRLHRLIETARTCGIPVYFARNWHGPNTDSIPWKSRRAGRSGGTAGVAGTWGAEWYEVEPRADEVVINKHRYDAFLNTPLETMLRTKGVETVVCCGTATNVCVESTARAAHMRDFHLVLVDDCSACTDPVMHEGTLENVRRHFGIVAGADDVEEAWRSRVADRATEPPHRTEAGVAGAR